MRVSAKLHALRQADYDTLTFNQFFLPKADSFGGGLDFLIFISSPSCYPSFVFYSNNVAVLRVLRIFFLVLSSFHLYLSLLYISRLVELNVLIIFTTKMFYLFRFIRVADYLSPSPSHCLKACVTLMNNAASATPLFNPQLRPQY